MKFRHFNMIYHFQNICLLNENHLVSVLALLMNERRSANNKQFNVSKLSYIEVN